MIRWFAYDHLPPALQATSQPFYGLAVQLSRDLPDCEERSVALRKLLEAKDAAVRAAIQGLENRQPTHIEGKE